MCANDDIQCSCSKAGTLKCLLAFCITWCIVWLLVMNLHIFHSVSFVQVRTWPSKKVSVILVFLIARTWCSALTDCSFVMIKIAWSSAGDCAMSSCYGGSSSKSSSSLSLSSLLATSTMGSSNFGVMSKQLVLAFVWHHPGHWVHCHCVHCMSQHLFQLLLIVSLHAWTASPVLGSSRSLATRSKRRWFAFWGPWFAWCLLWLTWFLIIIGG